MELKVIEEYLLGVNTGQSTPETTVLLALKHEAQLGAWDRECCWYPNACFLPYHFRAYRLASNHQQLHFST